MKRPVVGVLALQGDVREHLRALESAGAEPVRVRRPSELSRVDAMVLPGGESTAITLLARGSGLFDPLRDAVRSGLPTFGTCAGMVLLARELEDGAEGQETLGGLDVTVRRNGFGRQVDSFEEDLRCVGLVEPVRGVFIRAPWVTRTGPDVEVLARSSVPAQDLAGDRGSLAGEGGRIVAVRQGVLMATSFHPEVGGDDRLHKMFLELLRTT